VPESGRVRWLELAIVVFFAVNLVFITYVVDLEQLVIADPYHFSYPLWPPRFAVDAVHWWGQTYDPVLMARPIWWKVTIWIDALCFGPFYLVAIYAFLRRRPWIRVPALLWAATMLTNVSIILGRRGVRRASHAPAGDGRARQRRMGGVPVAGALSDGP